MNHSNRMVGNLLIATCLAGNMGCQPPVTSQPTPTTKAASAPLAQTNVTPVQTKVPPASVVTKTQNHLFQPRPFHMAKAESLNIVASHILLRGTVRKRSQYSYGLDFSDGHCVDLNVLWQASSPIVDALVGQEVTVRGDLIPIQERADCPSGSKPQFMVRGFTILPHNQSGPDVVSSLKYLNDTVLDHPVSMAGRLVAGRPEGSKDGPIRYMMVFDGNDAGVEVVLPPGDRGNADALVGKRALILGRFKSLPRPLQHRLEASDGAFYRVQFAMAFVMDPARPAMLQ